MKKVLLIYNPSSGRKRERRRAQVAKVMAVFQAVGLEVESSATTHVGSAVAQARTAASAGFDAVIACGGDGTANEVLNGLMISGGNLVMGVLPFGSGNLLATDLLLPSDPIAAARTLLTFAPRELKPGVMCYQGKSGVLRRYFLVAAGVGSDAELMYRTVVEEKERYGYYAYFFQMLPMAIRGRLKAFRVEWKDEQGMCRDGEAAMAMALRSHKFPGLLRRVRLGAGLTRNDYRLMLFRTTRVRHFLNFFCSVATGLNWKVPQVELVYSTWFRCTPLKSQDPASIHSEVDGELLGTLPVEVSIEPRTFKLLMPKQSFVG